MAPQESLFLLYMKILIHRVFYHYHKQEKIFFRKKIEAVFWSSALFLGLMDQKMAGSWNLESVVDFSFTPWLLAQKRKMILWKPTPKGNLSIYALDLLTHSTPRWTFTTLNKSFIVQRYSVWPLVLIKKRKKCPWTKE